MIKRALTLLMRDRRAFWWNTKAKVAHWGCSLFVKTGFQAQGKMDIDRRSWWHNPAFVTRYGGYFVPGDAVNRRLSSLEPWDTVRRDMIILLLRDLVERGVEGDLAELGVYKGSTARLIHHYLPERPFYLFDTFSGFDERDVQSEKTVTGLQTQQSHFSDTNVQIVLKNIAPQNEHVRVFPGYFPESVPPALRERRFAFVHLDADLYEPILAGLEFFYERMVPGGFILVHDFNSWPGSRRAVRDFFGGRPEVPIPMPDKSGSALITKLAPRSG